MRMLLMIGLLLLSPTAWAANEPSPEVYCGYGVISGAQCIQYQTLEQKRIQDREEQAQRRFEAWCRESSWWRMFNSDCPYKGEGK